MVTTLQSHQLSQPPQEQAESQEQSQTQEQRSSPPPSPSATSSPKSLSKRRSASPMSIDLSSLPPLSQPSPPSNTLLITQLNDATIFHPASVATIRQHINSLAPLHSFSPLKSFRRIVCSFYDTESAIRVRQHLDGAPLMGDVRTRVYFGEPTPIGEQTKYLDRPDAGKLFFISPPPSPPVGWEAKHEDPPNKDVHAHDLAEALGKLRGKMQHLGDAEEWPIDPEERSDPDATLEGDGGESTAKPSLRLIAPSHNCDASSPGSKPSSAVGPSSARNRSRSSTIIYDPGAHGDSPALPAVLVEDTTMDGLDDGDEDDNDVGGSEAILEGQGKKVFAHTTRPPVELMEQI